MKRRDINILLIDDEEIIVDELSNYLEHCGYNIKGLCNPKKAVELIKSDDFDMVITDLRMPDVSGMEIVKLVKNKNEDTLVLIITGYADTDSAIEAIQQGVYDFMRKPFEFKNIKSIVDRAADNIIMKRENQALNKKIKNMLNYVTTIIDISSILYQISDFASIIDMTLDTITEGLKIKKVGVLLQTDEKDTYSLYKSRNLGKQWENLTISASTKINSKSINTQEPTIIKSLSKNIKINNKQYSVADNVSSCLFIPISFRHELFGYLLVLETTDQSLSTDDGIKLLKILATQLAPVFIASDIRKQEKQGNIQSVEHIRKNIIKDSIKKARQKGYSVYFLQMKVIIKDNTELKDDYEELQNKFKAIIKESIPNASQILFSGFGSILIVLQESTPVEAEHICANIRTKVEQLHENEAGKPVFTLKYIMVAYPRDGQTYSEIIGNMEYKFYSSSTGLYIEKHGVAN